MPHWALFLTAFAQAVRLDVWSDIVQVAEERMTKTKKKKKNVRAAGGNTKRKKKKKKGKGKGKGKGKNLPPAHPRFPQ